MRKLLALSFVVAVTGGGVATSTAQAHFLYHHKHMTRQNKIDYFNRSIEHDRQALQWYERVRENVRAKLRHRPRSLAGISVFVVNLSRQIRWHKAALRWHLAQEERYRWKYEATLSPWQAIRYVFGVYSGQAWQVSGCESGHSVYAANGQYLGLFQMGDNERATYGHGSTPLEQARAAYNYFIASGRDWSPWTCKP